jgi:hypothetical protein
MNDASELIEPFKIAKEAIENINKGESNIVLNEDKCE